MELLAWVEIILGVKKYLICMFVCCWRRNGMDGCFGFGLTGLGWWKGETKLYKMNNGQTNKQASERDE